MLRQFAKNLSSNWAIYFVSAAISFLLTPYIIHVLGKAAYGIWLLVGSFSGYLGLFDFGIGYAVVRFVARYQKTGETDKRNAVVATAFYAAAVLAILVMAWTVYIMIYAASFFDIPAGLVSQSRIVIFLIGLSIAIGFPLAIFSEALAGGLYRYDLFNTVAIAMAFLRGALTFLFLELGYGLIGLGAAALIGSLLGYLWRMRMIYKLLPDLSIHPRLLNRSIFKEVGNYSLYSFVLLLSGRIAFYSDSFVVGFFRGVEDVAIFGIAAKLVEYLRQLVFTMSKLFSPVISRYDPDLDQASLRRLFYDGSRFNLLFSLPLSLLLFFWGGPFIRLWVGEGFASSIIILQVLLIGHLLSFMQGIGGELLLGVGRHRNFSIFSMIAAVVNVILSIVLVKSVGLVGVAWGTTIPLGLLSVGYLPFAAVKIVGGGMRHFLIEAIVPAFVATILPGLLIAFSASHIKSVSSLIGYSLLVLVVYLPSAYFWGLKRAERERLWSGIKRTI